MIFRNGKLVLESYQDTINQVQERVQKRIMAIYKGSQLVWVTIYNAIRSCFGSGKWLGDKPWLGTDAWKNN